MISTILFKIFCFLFLIFGISFLYIGYTLPFKVRFFLGRLKESYPAIRNIRSEGTLSVFSFSKLAQMYSALFQMLRHFVSKESVEDCLDIYAFDVKAVQETKDEKLIADLDLIVSRVMYAVRGFIIFFVGIILFWYFFQSTKSLLVEGSYCHTRLEDRFEQLVHGEHILPRGKDGSRVRKVLGKKYSLQQEEEFERKIL